MKKREFCSYCGRWYPASEMRQIEGEDNWYCPRCRSEVEENVRKLPWNKKI